MGHRKAKFNALSTLTIDSADWTMCPSDWRAPFLPASTGSWSTYPSLDDLFVYNGSGVMPGRTWVIAPDAESLRRRWQILLNAEGDQKEILFHPHLVDGKPGDRHTKRIVSKGLPGHEQRDITVANDKGPCVTPIRYGFRSFDRQWIIPDNRLINRPNPELWEVYSDSQVYLTAPSDRSPSVGPSLTYTSLIPDLHHYNGRGGRAFPLWHDCEATVPNIPPNLLSYLSQKYDRPVSAQDLFAYIAAVAAHPSFTARFKSDLVNPGLRIPLTADGEVFGAATELGLTVIWLHTFGERFANTDHGRPSGPPRHSSGGKPRISVTVPIPQDPGEMPDNIDYDAGSRRLHVGQGYVDGVEPRVWDYEISGKNVLRHWFSYRKANRERPIIGNRRTPSTLGNIQPDHCLAEYTTELVNLLNVLAWLVDLEPSQAELLEKICSSTTISRDELQAAGALDKPATLVRKIRAKGSSNQMSLFE